MVSGASFETRGHGFDSRWEQLRKALYFALRSKKKKADEAFGAPGSTAVLGALRAITTVRGIALGAFGEFSESIDVLIQLSNSAYRVDRNLAL